MLAVQFTRVVVALHVMAVVAGLGVMFAYPVVMPWLRRNHPKVMPAVHDAQDVLARRLISPGLLVILVAGIYLASKEHVWSEVWVSVPLVILIVLGGLGGAFISPRERKLAELARRDLQAGGDLGAEYDALLARVLRVDALAAFLVLVAIFFMVAKPGA
jgi:uncharacterized membrane protein